jgi:adenylate cyclase
MAQNFRAAELGETMAAVAELAAKAIALDPRDPLTWWASGRVRSVMAAHDEAIKHTEQAISLNPNYAMAWFGLANALSRFDPTDYALSAVDKAIALSPFDPFMPVFVHVRGTLLYLLGRFEDAVKDLEQAIHLGGVSVWCHLTRALAYDEMDRKDLARKAVQDMLQEYPNFVPATALRVGPTLFRRKDDYEAILRELGVPEE